MGYARFMTASFRCSGLAGVDRGAHHRPLAIGRINYSSPTKTFGSRCRIAGEEVDNITS